MRIYEDLKDLDRNSFPFIRLKNINSLTPGVSVVRKARLVRENTVPKYVLLVPLVISLSFGRTIVIPKGFIWDQASVPRKLWGLIPPDGDCELPALIHDFLYVNNKEIGISRKTADQEMLIWSKVTSGTQNKYSLRNLDNLIRYWGVRIGGWKRWNKNLKQI